MNFMHLRVFLEKLKVTELVKKCPNLTEFLGQTQHLQQNGLQSGQTEWSTDL